MTKVAAEAAAAVPFWLLSVLTYLASGVHRGTFFGFLSAAEMSICPAYERRLLLQWDVALAVDRSAVAQLCVGHDVLQTNRLVVGNEVPEIL